MTWRKRASRVAPNGLNSLWDSIFKKIETLYCRYFSINRYLQYDVDLFGISVNLKDASDRDMNQSVTKR